MTTHTESTVPATSLSPRAFVVQGKHAEVRVRVPRSVLVGDTVHLQARDRIAVGEVQHCSAIEAEYEIRVLVREIR
jgi:hypothetical protein